jgi:hypothetical protein
VASSASVCKKVRQRTVTINRNARTSEPLFEKHPAAPFERSTAHPANGAWELLRDRAEKPVQHLDDDTGMADSACEVQAR